MAITLYKEKAPVRGVLFDVDGVILDTERLYSRFWMEACHFYGFPMTKEQSLQMRSLNKTAGQEKFHELFGPKADYTTIRLKRIELMDAFIEKEGAAAKPGICTLLDALDSRGIPCAITSSSPRQRLECYLRRAAGQAGTGYLSAGRGGAGPSAGRLPCAGGLPRRNSVGLPCRLPAGADSRSGLPR